MNATPSRTVFGIALLISLFAGDATGQTVKVGGLAYVDYFYRLGDDDKDHYLHDPSDNSWSILWGAHDDVTVNDALHGFSYRRMYLTTDATISENFKARFRLEANDQQTRSRRPIPFVKDLWVDWNYASNHSARVGIMPPPAFQLSQDVWGFRSLEKTILDVQGINAPRDFGIRFDGSLSVQGDLVRYAVMLANGDPPIYFGLYNALYNEDGTRGTLPEHEKNKRGYAQISIHPSDKLVFSAGADYGKYSYQYTIDGEFIRWPTHREVRASVFGGYQGEVARFGVEAFRHTLKAVPERDEFGFLQTRPDISLRQFGISAFGSVKVNPLVEFVGRLDLNRNNVHSEEDDSSEIMLNDVLIVAGVAFIPNEYVRIIPNLWWFGADLELDDDVDFAGKRKNRMGRVTIEVSF